MFTRLMTANTTFRTLECISGRGFHVRAKCRCGHQGVVDGPLVARWFYIHRWPRALEVVHLHFRCSVCGVRGACRISPTPGHLPVTFPRWGPHDDREWNERIRKLRG
jgi:hypothetical protein